MSLWHIQTPKVCFVQSQFVQYTKVPALWSVMVDDTVYNTDLGSDSKMSFHVYFYGSLHMRQISPRVCKASVETEFFICRM